MTTSPIMYHFDYVVHAFIKGDLVKLVAYNFQKDMCDGGIVETKIVDIPAATLNG